MRNIWQIAQGERQQAPETPPEGNFQSRIEAAQFDAITRQIKALKVVTVVVAAVLCIGVIYFLLVSIIGSDPSSSGAGTIADTGVGMVEAPAEAEAGGQAPLREDFVQQLAQYEDEVEPLMEQMRMRELDAEQYAQAVGLKERALDHFTDRHYALAMAHLRRAEDLVAQTQAEHAELLLAAKRGAHEAFAQNRPRAAANFAARGLLFDPADADLLALQKRIATLPQVQALRARARIARTEQRPPKEIAALRQALALDPGHMDLRLRLDEVQAQWTRELFARFWLQAYRAIDQGDWVQARAQLARAQALLPDTPKLKALQKQLQDNDAKTEFNAQILLASQAQQDDNWPMVERAFGKALAIKPQDTQVADVLELAKRINASDRQLQMVLQNEQRLEDEQVAERIAAYLQTVSDLRTLSANLTQSYEAVAQLLATYAVKVQVRVRSDNNTLISVRGQGMIGTVSRHVIELRPGRYVFEGARKGYKSKLVKVELRPGDGPSQITLICDEKI